MRSNSILILSSLIAAVAFAGCETAPTMRLASATSAVGEEITVSFNAPIRGKASNLHWITLQSVDAPDSHSTGRVVVEHGQTIARLRATDSGPHEVRLHDRYPQQDSHVVARAPVRVLATRDQPDVPPAAGAPATEQECLDQWLTMEKLDAYGSPEGSVYAHVSPLYDRSAERMTPRTTYLYAKHPSAKVACAAPPAPTAR
jgi:hypothetical protein